MLNAKITKKIIFIFLIIHIPSSLLAQGINVIFRYDDFTLSNDSINEIIVNLFQKNRIPLVLGVIPFDKHGNVILQEDYSFMPLLEKGLQNQTIEIALHGYNHMKISSEGEFVNVPINEQYRRIKLGKQFLDSEFKNDIVTFIPPWNAYDENTLKVINLLGLKIISSSLAEGQDYSNEEIKYLPYTIGELELLIPTIENNKKSSGVIVLMFHRYDIGKTFTFNDLDNLLYNVSKYDLHFTTFSGLILQNEIANEKRFEANLEVNLLNKVLYSNYVLYNIRQLCFVRVLNLILYLIIVVFFYLLPFFFLQKLYKMEWKRIVVWGLLILFFCGISVWFHLLGPLKLLLLFCALALNTSAVLIIKFEFYKHKKQV